VFDVGNGVSMAVNPGSGAASVTVNQAVANSGAAALTVTAGSGSTAVSVQNFRSSATIDLLAAGAGATDIVRVNGAGLASGATPAVKGSVATQSTAGSAILYGGGGVPSLSTPNGTITLAGRGTVSYAGFNASGPLQQVLVQGTPVPAIAVSPAGGIAEGGGVTFSATDAANQPGVTYGWDPNGDGNFPDAAGASVTLTRAQHQSFAVRSAGRYAVAVRATSTQSVAFAGQSYTSSADAAETLVVANTAPRLARPTGFTAALGVDYTVPLTATDPGDATVTGWSVNWGDGTTDSLGATATAATHAYAEPGDYGVTVTVTDNTGGYFTTYTVAARPGVGSVTLSGPYAVSATDALVATPAAPGTPLRFEWSANGGATAFTTAGLTPTLTATLAQHVAAGVTAPGTVTLGVTAVYSLGAGTVQSASAPTSVTVVNPTPAGDLTPSVAPVVTLSTTTPTVTHGGANAFALELTVTEVGTETPLGYAVDWGDGTTSDVAGADLLAVHTYATLPAGGAYNVRLLSSTDSSGVDTPATTVTVSVTNAPPVVPAAGSVATGRRDLSFSWSVTAPDGSTFTTAGANGFVIGVAGYDFAVGNAAGFTPQLPGDYAVKLTDTDPTSATATFGP